MHSFKQSVHSVHFCTVLYKWLKMLSVSKKGYKNNNITRWQGTMLIMWIIKIFIDEGGDISTIRSETRGVWSPTPGKLLHSSILKINKHCDCPWRSPIQVLTQQMLLNFNNARTGVLPISYCENINSGFPWRSPIQVLTRQMLLNFNISGTGILPFCYREKTKFRWRPEPLVLHIPMPPNANLR